MYSEELRLLFVHISRTGGTTITNILRRSMADSYELLGQHEPLAAARPVLGDLFDDAFKFAFVRNPWERFVSWYALLERATEDDDDPARLVDPESEHWQRFDAFLESWSAQEVSIDGMRRRRLSQWAQIADVDGILLTDDLGRFETFADDVARLFDKAGVRSPTLARTNQSQHHHYSVYYSEFGRQLVADVFPEDVERLGYRFEDSDDTSSGA